MSSPSTFANPACTILTRYVLQALDLYQTAEKHLVKQLAKIKRIAELSVFEDFNTPERFPTTGEKRSEAEVNVTARLFKSNPVRNVLPGVLTDIRESLGLPESSVRQKNKGETKQQRPAQAEADGKDDSASVSDAGEDGVDMGQFEGRIASSDSDDSDEDMAEAAGAEYNPINDLSISPAPSVASDDSLPAAKTKKSKAKREPSTSTTTFLPTLMGGFWSGSESEAEDDDAAAPPQRKNRMGQQARRQLWEKKYGSGAKHLQKQARDNKNNRNSGWDMRRGAVSQDDARGKHGRFRATATQSRDRRDNTQRQEMTGSNQVPVGVKSKKPDVDEKIHPSWEAARKRKEANNQKSFQGKKIVFD